VQKPPHGRTTAFSGLVIEKTGDFYNASWITHGEVSASGVGMEVENG
jgi:hypothetical protein